jgi:hypothetical protein
MAAGAWGWQSHRYLWADCLEKCWSLDVSQPSGPSWPVTGIALPLPINVLNCITGYTRGPIGLILNLTVFRLSFRDQANYCLCRSLIPLSIVFLVCYSSLCRPTICPRYSVSTACLHPFHLGWHGLSIFPYRPECSSVFNCIAYLQFLTYFGASFMSNSTFS